ncbi:glycerate kinase [Modestobacter sp. DSM 44400]|uniref:glycerate kinase n=1 Tax=Modestobacter sp. DSM 44400 TaxID=1550230 RepID=UPI00089A3F03|nr:glycerate kinase [Modestobacter sp. DSM 44400]SDX98571.1 glycerate kinase [Modestobacter sp. DSM 44400]
MRVLVAPDKFKGSLSAAEVAAAVAAGLRRVVPSAIVAQVPVADGGEGTLEAALAAGFTRVPVQVAGPTGAPLDSAVAVRDRTAVVEMAAASGLALLPGGQPAPLAATSLGTGQLLRVALDLGCTEVVLGIGGSACTDGGAGLLAGLGARLLDAGGHDLVPGGGSLAHLDRVELSGLDPRLRGVRVVLASDVDNPLLGPSGAAAVYGPQKGASAGDVVVLEAALTRWAAALAGVVGSRAATAVPEPGAGAAVGVGYACLVALGAVRRPGVDVVLELGAFAEHLRGADLVLTGEGSLDDQTLRGKAPAGVAARARAAGVPVVAVAGRCSLGPDELREAGITAAYPLTAIEPDVDRCMREAGALLERLAGRIAQEHLLIPTTREASS